MANGRKSIETRSWGTLYRGDLAIHAAKGWTAADRGFADLWWIPLGMTPDRLPRGAVVAVVELYDVVRVATIVGGRMHGFKDDEGRLYQCSRHEFEYGNISRGRWVWLTRNPRQLVTPVECRGWQQLWDWTPPAEMRFR